MSPIFSAFTVNILELLWVYSSYSVVPLLTAKMSILLWITIEMKYRIKCLNFLLLFTNSRQ